jgi:hypothetical protein
MLLSKNVPSTLQLLTFPASVPNYSLQKRICRLLWRHFRYVTLLQLHFRGTKNAEIWLHQEGFALAVILACRCGSRSFFSYVMVRFRYVVISAGVLKLLISGHRHSKCQENTSSSK